MKGAPPAPLPEWSRRRFWGVAGGLCILQAGLLLLFGERARKFSSTLPEPGRFRLLASPLNPDQLSKAFFVIDPTVFPLPGLHGFSDRAWLKPVAPQFDAPAQTEGPAWLALDTSRLGTNFPQLRLLKTGLPFGLTIPQSAELEPWPVFLPPEKFRTESIFEIHGPLAARRLNGPVALPPRTNALLLSNSVVQIAVDEVGRVIATRLLGRSGSAEADSSAIEQARHLRFQPAPSPVWGKVSFEWQTVAPTNAGASATP